ncbi:MAG: hypothetical protein U0R64_10795 [Candidatus Nanopelagicales bacterium]
MTQAEVRDGSVAQRERVLRVVARVMSDNSTAWAWQGMPGVPQRWTEQTGPADLDLWCGDDLDPVVSQLAAALPAAPVALATDPRRLRHCSLAVETTAGLAVVDVTFGDLRVGPVLLVRREEITVRQGPGGPRLTGVSAAADLLVRPLLRGRIPEAARVEAARDSWREAEPDQRLTVAGHWRQQLGDLADAIVAALDGHVPDPALPGLLRRRLVTLTLSPTHLVSSLRQWRSIVPAGRSAGPLGLRTRGAVVALVGTDGAGKSTVAEDLRDRLERAGFHTSEAYFGMARGNLPGVGLARKVLGIDKAGDSATATATGTPAAPPATTDPGADRPALRRLAAWFYAGEYGWRYLRTVAPRRLRRDIVICDRYVYDLRESPWPGSRASWLVERIVPRPDILALPDAPATVIHARKPERQLAEQAAQQEKFRALLAERPARSAEVVVDTSGHTEDSVAPLVLAAISAASLPR